MSIWERILAEFESEGAGPEITEGFRLVYGEGGVSVIRGGVCVRAGGV